MTREMICRCHGTQGQELKLQSSLSPRRRRVVGLSAATDPRLIAGGAGNRGRDRDRDREPEGRETEAERRRREQDAMGGWSRLRRETKHLQMQRMVRVRSTRTPNISVGSNTPYKSYVPTLFLGLEPRIRKWRIGIENWDSRFVELNCKL
jgi:hypothetical protein